MKVSVIIASIGRGDVTLIGVIGLGLPFFLSSLPCRTTAADADSGGGHLEVRRL